MKTYNQKIVPILLFILIVQIYTAANVCAAPWYVEEQEYEWNQFKQGFPNANDSRFVFGLTYQIYTYFLTLTDGGTSVKDFENMIETYLIPHNIYWTTIFNYQRANTSNTKPENVTTLHNFLTAADKYGLHCIFYTPTLSFKSNPWGEDVINAWGEEYKEVYKNGTTSSQHARFDYLDKWKWQQREDIKHLKVLYGKHPSFAGVIVYWEFRAFRYEHYSQLGYSNQSLNNFTRTDYYKQTVNSTGYHSDGTKCKLWEMFVDETQQYNTSELSTDVDSYHKSAFNNYKDECFIRIWNDYITYFRETINPDAILFHDSGGAPPLEQRFSVDGVVWFANRRAGGGEIDGRPTPMSDGWDQLLNTYHRGFAWTSQIAGNWSGNNNGGALPEDVVWQLTMTVSPYFTPIIWIMVNLGRFKDGYMDVHKSFATISNRIRFSRQKGFENPIANILFVTGPIGEAYAGIPDPNGYWLGWFWFLNSLGFNVTHAYAYPDEVKYFENLTQFDSIIWWSRYHPDDTTFNATDKVIDAVMHGTGLFLLGDSYAFRPSGGAYTNAYGQYAKGPFDAKLWQLVPLDYYWEDGELKTFKDADSWEFTNLTHSIWKPYSSFSLNDFLWSTNTGRHMAYVKKQPWYDGNLTKDLIYDDAGQLVACAVPENTTTGRGRILWFGMRDFSGGDVSDGKIYSKATTVLVNGILWTAKKDDYIPLITFEEKHSELFLNFLYGDQAILWFSNNASTEKIVNLSLNSKLFNLQSNWIAIKLRTWEVVKAGSSTNVSLSFTIPAKTWEPILLVNQTSNLHDLYSNMFVKSRSISVDKATHTLQGPYNQTGWLITNSTKTPVNVTANNTGTLPQHTALTTINEVTVPDGWYHDPNNKILYIKFKPTSTVQIELTQPTGPTHTLNIYSSPVTGVPFTLDVASHITPFSMTPSEGTHTIVMPSTSTVAGKTYNFVKWEDGTTNPTRTISLTTDMTLTAYYQVYSPPSPSPPPPSPPLSYPPTNEAQNLTNSSIGKQGTLAMKQPYIFQVKVTDPEGATNLNYVDLTLDPSGHAIKVRWTENNNTWIEINDPNDYIYLGNCSKSISNNQITLNFAIRFRWTYPDENLHLVQVYSVDDDELSDTDEFPNIYYVEKDLAIQPPSVSDTRVNPNQTINVSGNIYYEGTSIYPPDGDYQVRVKLSGIQKGPTNTTLTSGHYSIVIPAETAVGSYTYQVSCDHNASAVDTPLVIVDKLMVSITADTPEVDLKKRVNFTITITRQYDSTNVTSFTITLTRNGTTWLTLTTKNFNDVLSTPGHYTYSTESITDNTYGLTTFETNNLVVTWRQKLVNIAIQVKDQATNTPISGASVYIKNNTWASETMYTNVDGWANFTRVETGTYTIVGSAEGYSPASDTVSTITDATYALLLSRATTVLEFASVLVATSLLSLTCLAFVLIFMARRV